MNAYMMNELLKGMIGEETAAHWGVDNLLMRMNLSQGKVATLIMSYPGSWLTKSKDLTPVASVITLPTDCGKPLYMEIKANGQPVSWLGNVRLRRVSRGTGDVSFDNNYASGGVEAYVLAKTIEINSVDFTDEVTLWYEERVPDLMTGTGSAGGLLELTFPDTINVKRVDDYYNGVGLEVASGTGSGTVTTISNFVAATRVCTLAAGTCGADSVFGTVSVLPEEAVMLVILETALFALAKPSSTVDKEVWQFYFSERKEAKKVLEEWLETRVKGFSRVATTELY
jgi:hypothetical protein